MKLTGKVDDEEVDDELSDLHGGEILLPPDPATTSGSPVIVVYKASTCNQLSVGTKLAVNDLHIKTWTAKLRVMTTHETLVRPLSCVKQRIAVAE